MTMKNLWLGGNVLFASKISNNTGGCENTVERTSITFCSHLALLSYSKPVLVLFALLASKKGHDFRMLIGALTN